MSSKPHNREGAASTSGLTMADKSLDDDNRAVELCEMINQDLNSINNKVKNYFNYVNDQIKQSADKVEVLKTSGSSNTEFEKLKVMVSKLKFQIDSNLKVPSASSKQRRNDSNSEVPSGSSKRLRNPMEDNLLDGKKAHESSGFAESSAFEHMAFQLFETSFLALPFELKLCLISFMSFPKECIIKKRTLVYWWIGEGFLLPTLKSRKAVEEIKRGKTEEEFGNEFLDKLILKGFIEPVYRKSCSSFLESCWMRPFVRSRLSLLAERLEYLVETLKHGANEFSGWLNVDEDFIDAEPELLSGMKHLHILYLGRWRRSSSKHIEVTNTGFFDGLRDLNQLRYLSLRGISMITELPDLICRLQNLKILDLRACYNFEVVPDGISSLKNLTHLDMSECYFVDHMPKGIALLSQLQVLKGFYIGNSKGKNQCTLDDLAELTNLRKLNIYTSLKDFPAINHLRALEEIKGLLRLKISWGGSSLMARAKTGCMEAKDEQETATTDIENPQTKRQSGKNEVTGNLDFSLKLEKIEVQGFPGSKCPVWLRPANLKHLRKLYISGGGMCDLGPFHDHGDDGAVSTIHAHPWNIEILRLKYLSEMEMSWLELGTLFPKLICLEKVECPKLNDFPCNDEGMWLKC